MPSSSNPSPEQLANHLSGRHALLILDNCEHLVDGVAAFAESMIQKCSGLHLLATSREPLGVEAERVYRVGSLPAADAISLFFDRARQAAADIELTVQDHEAISTICERLDGIPLAIELAASCIGSMTPAGILRRLDERFRLLIGGRRAIPRHRTLRAAVEWSEELLSPDERLVFHRLGVFVGGFDLAAVRAVVVDLGTVKEEAAAVLRRLVERSMVIVDREAGQ
jgi:predicted ATPase